MSLLNDVLKDLDARHGQRSGEIPAGLSSAPAGSSGRRLVRSGWLVLTVFAAGLGAAGWWMLAEGPGETVAVASPDADPATASAEVVRAPAVPALQEKDPQEAEVVLHSEVEPVSVQASPEDQASQPKASVSKVDHKQARDTAPSQARDTEAEQIGQVPGQPAVETNAAENNEVAVRTLPPAEPVQVVAREKPDPQEVPRAVERTSLNKAPVRTPAEEAEAIVRKARALQSADPEQARRILEAGLARLPEQAALREALVRMLVKARDLEAARRVLRSAPAPLNATLLGLRGWIEQQMGDARASVATYSELLRQEPENARWWSGLAIGLEQTGQLQQAQRAWAQVVQLPEVDARLLSWARQRMAALRGGEN